MTRRLHRSLLAGTSVLLAGVARGAGPAPTADEAVLVEIGEDRFTMTDFQLYLRQANPRLEFATLPPGEQRYWLDDFVGRKLFALRARQAGLDQAPETRARIAFFVDGVLAQAFKDHVLHEVTVSEAELESYYRDHPKEFELPARVLLQHFLYRTPAKAARVHTRLQQGAAFDRIAEEKKVDPDLVLAERAWFTAETLLPELAEVAFQLPVGTASDVVRSRYGHHVLRVEASEAGRRKGFAAARAELSEKVRRAKAGRRYQEALDQTREERRVRFHFRPSGPTN
jgi:peptidyl-prolyl cis-trans isomerase C